MRRTFGLVTGGDFNIGLLLVCNVAGAVLLVAPELAVAPVVPASSSSSITIGWSASAMVASEEVAASCTARGRSIGDALKISPTLLMGTRATRLDEIILIGQTHTTQISWLPP